MTLYDAAVAYDSAIPYNGTPDTVLPPAWVPKVEVAFAANPMSTPTAGIWIDVSAYLKGFQTSRGKTHELAQSQAGEVTLVLDNKARTFDPTYTSSPYYPNVVPMRRVRISVTYNLSTYLIATGFVEDWGQTWPSRVQNAQGAAECVVKIVDGFKLLSLLELVAYSAQVAADEPLTYWRLDETGLPPTPILSEGSVDGFAFALPDGNLELGALGPLIGDATSLDLTSYDPSNALTTAATSEELQLYGDATVEFWFFAAPAAGAGETALVSVFDPVANVRYAVLGVTNAASPVLRWEQTEGANQATYDGPALTAGQWVHVAVVRSERTLLFYTDGVLTSTVTFSRRVANAGPATVQIGDAASNGQLAHVAVYGYAVDDSRIAAHADANFDRFVSQSTGAHIDKILTTVGWPATERDLDTGVSTVAEVTPSGNALSWLLQVAETTEQGLLRCAVDNKLTFSDRQALLTLVTAATFGDGGGTEVSYSDIGIRYDDADLYSQVTVSGLAGVTHAASDATSQAAYGPRTLDVSGSLVANEEELSDEAAYLLGRYKAPAVRVERVNFLASTDGATLLQLFTRELGDRITVKRRPPGGGTITQDCLLEGVRHTATATTPWETEWSLVPVDPNHYFILDTSVLDGPDVLAY